MLTEIAFVAGAYLLGSIPVGLLLAKAAGVDIRETGSGNIGATNVYRTMGRTVGIMTLAGDCLKGLIPALLAQKLNLPDHWLAAICLAAFLGHVYTIFLRFKGGKGVATALGVFLTVSPLAVLLAMAAFFLVIRLWRYVSLASITAATLMPFLIALLDRRPFIIAMTLAIALIVIYKHKDNIRRLRDGTESKFKA